MRTRLLPIAVLALLAACAELSTPPSESGLAAAKVGGGVEVRATWHFYGTLSDNVTSTNFYGDGLAADGVTPAEPSVYQGGRCTVRAAILASGDATFNPGDGSNNDPTCSTARRNRAVIGGATLTVMWTGVVKQLMQVPLGQSSVQNLNWGPVTQIASCDRLIYTAEVGSQVRVTRTLGDASGTPGEWIVESAGNHRAGCYRVKGGSATWTGVYHYLPFRAKIVELR